jgi:phytoene synthase
MTRPTPAALERRLIRALKASGSSFYWGIRLLPRHQRSDLAVVYLFCRQIDDIADGTLPEEVKERELTAWKDALVGAAANSSTGRPTLQGQALPLVAMLRQVMERHTLSPSLLIEIIDGVRMDLQGGICAPDRATFALYCRRVAGCVGVATVRILGSQGQAVDRFAIDTGDALQMTNILRDLYDDAAENRLYLPAPLLDLHGITSRSPAAVITDPAIEAVCFDLAEQAEQSFAIALREYRALPRIDRHRLRPALVMLSSYRLILKKLRARGWAPQALAQPCRPSRLRLLGDALQAWVLGR